MRLPIIIVIILFCCSPYFSGAQLKIYYPDSSVKVTAYGIEQTMAWGGGFNNPQFTMGDLNHDGLPDLVIFEPWIGLRTFINKGTPGNPDYRYDPVYAQNFPEILDYVILADYNCDNVPDLFHQGSFGMSVYSGYYNAQDQLCFTFYSDLRYFNDLDAHGAANVFNNPGDIPSVVDVDNDGDLDIVSYNNTGGFMNFYKNMRIEDGLPCDSIRVKLVDHCWGKVYQGFYRTHYLAQTCDNSHLMRSAEKKTHSGNTPCLFDWDMDGDYDYVDGSVSYNEMTFLKNGKSGPGGVDTMIFQDTLWQTGGKRIDIPIFPAAYNIDIDQDGKKDLIIAPNGGNASKNYNNIWFYKNYTFPGTPDWRFQSDSFLSDKTIDLGTAAYPTLFDYNRDGKPDLFIGSDGYQQSSGLLRSRISYYMNTSTPGHPSFVLQTKDFLGINTYNFQGAAPAMGDIDNDGKADMIIGHTDGTLSYFKNMAGSDTAQPNWLLVQLQLTDASSNVIMASDHAAPFIYDIDKDGKKDLVIGAGDGYLQYYRNVATTPGSIKLQLVNTQLGGAHVDPLRNVGKFSTPFIGKIDSTGVEYLIMGSNSGIIYKFSGFQSGDTTAIYTMVDSQFSYIDTAYNVYYHMGSSFSGVYDDLRSAPVIGDIAGDGNYEMFVGMAMGGVQLYKWGNHVVSVGQQGRAEGKVLIYPNPANDMLRISWSGMQRPDITLSIVDITGHQLYNSTVPAAYLHTQIPVAFLPSGLYICVLQSGDDRFYNKFTIVK